MTTFAIEYEPSPSKTGVQVVPAFVVFQTPPDADATYQIFLSVGCTARSTTRPEVSAGPIDRNLRPPYGPPAPPRDVESPGAESDRWVAADVAAVAGAVCCAGVRARLAGRCAGCCAWRDLATSNAARHR